SIGNVTQLTDSAGTPVEQYSYDVFGSPVITGANGTVSNTSAFGNRFLFTGREYVSQIGLYDYRARFYSPELGRFLQVDPISFASVVEQDCQTYPLYNEWAFGGFNIEVLSPFLGIISLNPFELMSLVPLRIVTFASGALNLYRYGDNDPVNIT